MCALQLSNPFCVCFVVLGSTLFAFVILGSIFECDSSVACSRVHFVCGSVRFEVPSGCSVFFITHSPFLHQGLYA